jgi:hypothetical protein
MCLTQTSKEVRRLVEGGVFTHLWTAENNPDRYEAKHIKVKLDQTPQFWSNSHLITSERRLLGFNLYYHGEKIPRKRCEYHDHGAKPIVVPSESVPHFEPPLPILQDDTKVLTKADSSSSSSSRKKEVTKIKNKYFDSDSEADIDSD